MNDLRDSYSKAAAPQSLLAKVLSRIRRALGSLFQLIFHDQIGDIRRQVQRLGSASVESTTYLASEVRSLDQRLVQIETELAALRELLEREHDARTKPAEAPTQVPAQPHAS